MNHKSIKALIIEDEDAGHEMLSNLLIDFCPQVQILGRAADIIEGKKMIESLHPELVFMDIKMPHGNAFDLIDSLQKVDFAIIFTTAHNEFAVKAFRLSAIDYLLKPIHPDELVEAVSKLESTTSFAHQKERLNLLRKSLGGEAPSIQFPTMEGVDFFKPEEILRFEGDGRYTQAVLVSEKKILLSKNIGQVEKMVEDKGFFRIHNSHIINLRCIRRYVKNGSGYVVLSDGSHVDISRRRKEGFLEVMGSL